MKTLCIYHGNCADGFMSAWIVRRALSSSAVDFHAGVYQDQPPDVTGRDVLLVDFSYKRPVMTEIVAKANSVTVLDHHKTAAEDLLPMLDAGEIRGVFDMERSGAGITWDFYFPSEPRPFLVNHVEDRDLWRFKLPMTREIQAAVFSYPYDFAIWDGLVNSFDQFGGTMLAVEGAAIERKHHKDIAELVKVVTRPMKFDLSLSVAESLGIPGGASVVVPMANLPYTLTSDAGHLLCGDEHPFAGCYWDTPEGRVFSLRSRDNGADVGAIAKQWGGGGHAHASGFRVPFDQLAQFEP